MRILFFTKSDASIGSSRQRVWFLAEHLKRAYGYDYDILRSINHSFWLPSFKRFRTLMDICRNLRAESYKLIYIHKSLYPWDVILLILFAKWRWQKKLIYDLDDAEWIHSPMKSALIARNADAIIAGSHAIKEWALRFTDAVTLIPTVIDASIYQRFTVTHTADTPATIG